MIWHIFKMLVKSIILFYLCTSLSNGEYWDRYTGELVSKCNYTFFEEHDLVDTCLADIQPCDENEGRRVDGSCNNLKHPAKGIYFQPLARILPAAYHDGWHARRALSGNELPPVRKVRLHLIRTGKSHHSLFNHNVGGYLIFEFNDHGSVHDIENMLLNKTDCCVEGHMNDIECTPNMIAEDDPVHRFSGIRCMNSTRALYYQNFNCTTDPVPAPIAKASGAWDLSQIYDAHGKGDKVIRSWCGGKLLVEEEEGKNFPPNGPTAFCPNNQGKETRCFENYLNTLMPITLLTTWFLRLHNEVATELATVNPCWDDDKLFFTTRDICIAWSQHMYLYQMLPAIQGHDHLVKNGIITKDEGFRDIYDENKYPEMTVEYGFIVRFFHLMQEGTAKLYDKDGNFIKDFPLLNTTFRVGMFPQNIVELTQSTFRAPCRAFDYTVDPEMADNSLPGVQHSIDALAGDLNKGRYYGVAPFIDYVYYFTGRNITCFEDLEEFIPKENIQLLKEVYERVEDIDLLAGCWVGKKMEGGEIPYIVASIMNDHVMRMIKGDRHFYDNPNRPYAFTEAQLEEIKKATLSLMLCKVGDDVTEVPKNSFLKISCENPLVSCSDVPQMDFSAWADDACNSCSES